MEPGGVIGRPLGHTPFLKHRRCDLIEHFHLFGGANIGGHNAMAIWVEK